MKFVSYAQNFEDVILFRALKHVWNGTYVDVGAYDPQRDSVTKAFYDRGWSGFNIEPVATFHERLTAARPRDRNIHAAAGDVEGELTCYVIAETGLSTLDRETAETHRRQGFQIAETPVPVLQLKSILKDFSERPIHFLKIDVEGFEENVLAGMDFQRIRPWILVIEATLPTQDVQTHEKWEQLVLSDGYSFAFFDGLSRYYIADEHSDLKRQLAIPANVFDDYETAYVVELKQAIAGAQESYSSLLAQMEVERRDNEAYGKTLDQRIYELDCRILELDRQLLETVEEHERYLKNVTLDHERQLNEQRKIAAEEEQRLHASLQATLHHLSRMENSRGWRLVLWLRRPLNFARRFSRRSIASVAESHVGSSVKENALVGEIRFAPKEFARRMMLKSHLKR